MITTITAGITIEGVGRQTRGIDARVVAGVEAEVAHQMTAREEGIEVTEGACPTRMSFMSHAV